MNILATLRGQWARAWERWLPPVAWMGLIFYLSSQPDLPSAPEPLLDLILKKTAHAFVYAVLAALFHRAVNGRGVHWKKPPPLPSPPSRSSLPISENALLEAGQSAPAIPPIPFLPPLDGRGRGCRAPVGLRRPGASDSKAGKSRGLQRYLVPWLLAVLYAVTDEMHQTFVPGRSGRMTDVLIDAVGAAAGVLVMAWLRRRRARS